MNILKYYSSIMILLYKCPEDMVISDTEVDCDNCIGYLSGGCLYYHFYDAYFDFNSSRAIKKN